MRVHLYYRRNLVRANFVSQQIGIISGGEILSAGSIIIMSEIGCCCCCFCLWNAD